MVTKEKFRKLLEDNKSYSKYCDTLESLGINIIESESFTFATGLFDFIISENFNLWQSELIYWWIFEDDYGKRGLEWNDETIDTFDKLWNKLTSNDL